MPEMYCPRCGRELDLDSGEIRFCRYCGFSLDDTKDALRGYSEQKRLGFTIVTCSYVLLLIVTLLLHGQYVSLNTGWVYWLLTLLVVASVSLFISAATSALKPALFLKAMRGDKTRLPADRADVISSTEENRASLPPARVPVNDIRNQPVAKEPVSEPRSVIEGTTKRLDDRNHKGSST
jgi:hypothetical protein